MLQGGTDGGAHVKLLASGDNMTEILACIVREHGIVSLEQAHHQMSYVPARFFGFEKRGALIEGHAADIMIYDKDKVGSTRHYGKIWDVPDGGFRRVVRPTGMHQVIVNGETIFDRELCTGALPGRVLSYGPALDDVEPRAMAIAAE